MQEPTIFQVQFPLSQVPGMFSMLPRSNSVEDCLRTMNSHYTLPSELFSEEDVLPSPPLLFSNTEMELSSDSDLDNELFRRSNSPTDELTSGVTHNCPRMETVNGSNIDVLPPPPPPPSSEKKPLMEKFPLDKVSDFKHVIYNLLVDHHNSPELVPFIEPVQIVLDGEVRSGFRFPEPYNPEKRLPELYAQHIRQARLDLENQDSIFIQDLYKFYLRAVLELLAKYFEKCDKYTFLDDDAPLFVPNTCLKEAEARMKTMRTRARKRKTACRETKKKPRKNKRDW